VIVDIYLVHNEVDVHDDGFPSYAQAEGGAGARGTGPAPRGTGPAR
jgi:hypothetical protein